MNEIKSVSINDVTKIGKNCFNGAQQISELVLPDTLEIIEENVFKNCNGLENPCQTTVFDNNTINVFIHKLVQ